MLLQDFRIRDEGPDLSHQGILRIQDAGTSDLFDFNFSDEDQKSGVDSSLLEVFDEFRKSLTAEGPPDFETHLPAWHRFIEK